MGSTSLANARKSDHLRRTPVEERFGDYVLLERLGKGGMAEVHRARLERSAEFRKVVALKRVLPDLANEGDFRDRFLEEARTVAQLQHPNVVHVFDFGEVDDRPYIVMELIDGIDLWRLVGIAQRKKMLLDLPTAMFIVAEAARGLGYAHSVMRDGVPLGIVHRDVSPQNILLSRLGEVKVADFGIAKATSTVFERHCKTTNGAIIGKLRYMSPEQVTGGNLDGRSDIFALGVVLHELLTSAQLVDAQSPAGVVDQVKAASFEPPSKKNPLVPPKLDEIVMRALSRSPSDRYPRAEDLARALSALIAELAPGYGRDALGDLVGSLSATAPATIPSVRVDSISVEEVISEEVSDSGVIEDRSAVRPRGRKTARSRPERAAAISLHTGDFIEDTSLSEPHPGMHDTAGGSTRRVAMPRIGRGRATGPSRAVLLLGLLPLIGITGLFLARPTKAPVAPVPVAVAAPIVAPVPPVVLAPPAPSTAVVVAVAAAKPRTMPKRMLDGKIVVRDADAAPAGEEAAVARARASYANAQTALIRDRFVEAEAGFQAALSAYPGFVAAYRGLGATYAHQGQTELAVSSLRTYLRGAPGASDRALVLQQITRLEHGEMLASLKHDPL